MTWPSSLPAEIKPLVEKMSSLMGEQWLESSE
jgi:hypothetical protein